MAARQVGFKPKKSSLKHSSSPHPSADSERLKENVTVTVRFRPLSQKEIRQGEEIAWYADGETIVRNEHSASIAYAYDQVFGPTTTTRRVYDTSAQHVVSGAMEGINGTIFAYGVTSSGKTHTMHGDQRSPGIIPLAIKDAFSIIQETPRREFLLRLSYLEIYNEVINDLLNPAGHHLRIREDNQGTFVEGIKEEVVLSPGHALSIIAAGEEKRHVGSTNFNLHSSRSHTIFTLTIESSPCGENNEGESVNLSQLNLIDLAGSESSKAETTGIRRKEGSYINKSLLTLGTVISKLTEERAAHIPYRDSKLTRLLQSSLSGHGRVSLICTVTPSSSNSEETHNTLKFAHRAKHIEIQAAQNKIIDEKSLIKTYQNEIRLKKEKLEQLKKGTVTVSQLNHIEGNEAVLLKDELEDGQVKLESRSEQEEAEDALLSQIQNLTKSILVSTKPPHLSKLSHHPTPVSRYSFGEEELAYLPHRKRDLILDDENILMHVPCDGGMGIENDSLKEDKKIKKPGLLNWLKPRKRDGISRALTGNSDQSSGAKSTSSPSSPADYHILPIESRHSCSSPSECTSVGFLSEARQDREFNKDDFLQQETPLTNTETIFQIDLREQQNILSVEVANHFIALQRLSADAARDGNKESIKVEMAKLNDEIKHTNKQISLLKNQTTNSIIPSPHFKKDDVKKSQSVSKLEAQLNEKSFELKAQATNNQVIQKKLNQKNHESKGLQETITTLKQQIAEAHDLNSLDKLNADTEITTINDSDMLFQQDQELEIDQLKQKIAELTKSKEQLEAENVRLAEESSYAKELASAAANELKALSEEVMKLMNNNDILSSKLPSQKNSPTGRKTVGPTREKKQQSPTQLELKRELALSKEREMAYEAILSEKDRIESELQETVKESKAREAYLENELANMWILVSKLRKSQESETNDSESNRESPEGGFEI